MLRKAVITLAALCGLVHGFWAVAAAAEVVKVAVPDLGAWNSSFTGLGRQQGFFRKQGVDVEIVHVGDEASLEKALISGDADIGVAAIFPDVLVARVGGAPIKIISPEETGAPDIFWFARVGGPIRSMRDLRGQPVGFGGIGSLSHYVLLNLLKDAGVHDARLVPTLPADGGIGAVINAQLAASWGGPVAAVKDLLAGEVRVIGRGDDSALVKDQTLRVNVVNARFLTTHRESVFAFLKAYKRSVDWAYSSQAALEDYAKISDQSLEFVKYIVAEFASKESNQLDELKGEDRMIARLMATGRIPHALQDRIGGAYDFVLKNSRR